MQKEIVIPIVIVFVLALGTTFILKDKQSRNNNRNGKTTESTTEERAAVMSTVTQFGKQLQNVPLASPKDAAALAIESVYKPFATEQVIASWRVDPLKAPGRSSSSPWPDRIEIDSTQKQGDGSYLVQGTVVEVTSKEVTRGGVAATYPVTLMLQKVGSAWLISSYSRGAYSTSTNFKE